MTQDLKTSNLSLQIQLQRVQTLQIQVNDLSQSLQRSKQLVQNLDWLTEDLITYSKKLGKQRNNFVIPLVLSSVAIVAGTTIDFATDTKFPVYSISITGVAIAINVAGHYIGWW